jgi:hypothetical protein
VRALEAVGGGAGDPLAGGDAARQRDHRHVGVGDDAGADRITGAGDDVQHAGWEDLGGQLGEAERRHRGDLGRFEGDDIARGERGRDLPDRHHRRVVPGRDLTDDADRLAAHERRVVGAVLARGRCVEGAGGAGEEPQLVRADGQLLGGERPRLANVGRFERGEFVGVAVDRVGERQQGFHALAGGRVPPPDPRRAGGAQRALDVVPGALGHPADGLTVGGVVDVARGSVDRVDELAADEVAQLVPRRDAHAATGSETT